MLSFCFSSNLSENGRKPQLKRETPRAMMFAVIGAAPLWSLSSITACEPDSSFVAALFSFVKSAEIRMFSTSRLVNMGDLEASQVNNCESGDVSAGVSPPLPAAVSSPSGARMDPFGVLGGSLEHAPLNARPGKSRAARVIECAWFIEYSTMNKVWYRERNPRRCG